jgi:hypothetical protein
MYGSVINGKDMCARKGEEVVDAQLLDVATDSPALAAGA